MKTFTIFLLFSKLCLASGFDSLESYLFKRPDPGMKTEAFVLQKDGKVVFSRFDHGGPETLHLLWSMSKSVSSLLFGIAQQKGHIQASDSIAKWYAEELSSFPRKKRQKWEKITLQHLLQMSSGLAWQEYYEKDPFNSHVVKMLYLKAQGSMANYVLSIKPAREPGAYFLYSSGDTNLVTGALKKALPGSLKNTYPWDWLFDPMEIEAVFEQDGSGTFLGSSYLYLKTKDLLKIGQLIIDKGSYKGKRIVAPEYVEFATSLSGSMKKRGCLKDSYMTYGAQFWLNAKCPDGKRPFETVPDSLVMMLGHGGQSVFIFPEQEIVAVRISQDQEKAMNKEKYARLILEALNEI